VLKPSRKESEKKKKETSKEKNPARMIKIVLEGKFISLPHLLGFKGSDDKES
jgi:hypothetical protein